MTATERSLLLYLETCSVDFAGRVHPEKMNDDDRGALERWTEEGFVQHGRIVVEDHNRDGCLWVRLSEEAWTAAHAERRARADRVWTKKRYTTTAENRAQLPVGAAELAAQSEERARGLLEQCET